MSLLLIQFKDDVALDRIAEYIAHLPKREEYSDTVEYLELREKKIPKEVNHV